MKQLGFWIKFFGLILFFFLIYKIGWKNTLVSIQKVSFLHILVSVLILWVAFYLKSSRWRIISRSYDVPLEGYEAFKIFFIGLFLANITPGKLGDFGRLLYIKDKVPNKKIGLASLLMDRVFDLICLLLFSAFAFLYYQVHFKILKSPNNYESFFGWSIGLATILFILVIFRKKIIKTLKPWWIAFNSNDLGFYNGSKAVVITCLSMVLMYGVINYIAWSMKIEIDHLGLFLGSFIIGVLTLLPITILGIGVRETSLVLIFQLYNLPSEDAIALSLIVFFVQLISFLPGAIWFYLSPIRLQDLRTMK